MDLDMTLPPGPRRRRAIYEHLRNALLEGKLRAGEPLPPSRELASRLGVSRATVLSAYDQLVGEGFVRTRPGAGTYVTQLPGLQSRPARQAAGQASAVSPPQPWAAIPLPSAFDVQAELDFRSGLPDTSLFPLATWRRHTQRVLTVGHLGKGIYGEPAGDERLREAISRHIALSRGVVTDPGSVIVTSGAQQAIDLVARVLAGPGDQVAVEDPGYEPARWLFQSLRLRIAGVPVDREGIVVEDIPAGVRLVYVTPSHQYPLGVVLSLQRRLALLDWAHRTDAVIIEDDYDSEFRFGGRAIEPLWTLDRDGRVIYVGSFSKTMLPSLRLGFLITPHGLRAALLAAKYVTDWHTSLVTQKAMASFIDEGDFARHIRKMRAVYAQRHELVTATIRDAFADHLEPVTSGVGIHIAAHAPRAAVHDIDHVAGRALQHGVAVQRLHRFIVTRQPLSGLVIGYGAIPTNRITEGLDRLLQCFSA
ncbi:MAG: PLP-dependent aminotransferase family protein [Nocardiopsaceae bacterium]|jgi:GntR family transcriptional regulator/MocR family aminotransferase|nr:PLP-dependent aminotransferase family protein [Nocardiopsaceae bacterium]